MMKWLPLLFLLILFIGNIDAQDIENSYQTFRDRWENDPIRFSGGINATLQFNAINGAPQRRDPFNANVFGNINFDILGVNAPLSLAIADGNTTYNLPSYSFVGISPSYRWIKLHLFRRNMQFGKYTLSGHGFNGVGFELSPGKFSCMGMYGTLRKARLEDFGFRQELDPFYARKGYAFKAGYKDGGDEIFATIFSAADDPNSLSLPDSLDINPQENVVLSLEGRKVITDALEIEAEYAHSIITSSNNFPERRTVGMEKLFRPFLTLNSTSKSSSAYNFAVDFSPVQDWSLSLKYERVNPNFLSLGTLQFRNDFENISVGYRGKLFKKMVLNGRIGVEHNNLDGFEIEGRNRFLGSVQLNLPVTKRWQNALSYSNFRQTTRLLDNSNPFEPVDSIFLGSVNNQWSFTSSLQFADVHRAVVNASWQTANTIMQERITQATSTVRNIGLNYQYIPAESKWGGGAMIFWNGLLQSQVRTSVLSPSLQINYRASDQLQFNAVLTDNFSRINGLSNGSILRLIFGGNYNLSKKQRLNFRLQYIDRSGAVANNFKEVFGQIGYGLKF